MGDPLAEHSYAGLFQALFAGCLLGQVRIFANTYCNGRGLFLVSIGVRLLPYYSSSRIDSLLRILA